jgi:hypothetical protein
MMEIYQRFLTIDMNDHLYQLNEVMVEIDHQQNGCYSIENEYKKISHK